MAGLALGSLLAAMAMFVSAYVECWRRDWTPRLPGLRGKGDAECSEPFWLSPATTTTATTTTATATATQ